MRTSNSKWPFTLTLAVIAQTVAFALPADTASLPFVSPMFGDNMVLQRGKPNAIWGWSKPGQVVRVEIAGRAARTVAGTDDRWQVEIQPPAPGGPYTIKIEGPQSVELHDVLVGDVWLCGGQSNMQLGLARTRNGADEIKSANHPEIRLYMVQAHPAYSPAAVPQGRWKICSPQTVTEDGGFSAVAYFFARRVREEVHVPIGLVEDCLGGTSAEAWTSSQKLHRLKDFEAQLAAMDRLKAKGGPEYGNYIMHWKDEYDIGLKSNTWAAATLADSSWKTVRIPGGFQELGVADVPSVCWFRKEITLPDPLPMGAATLFLGVIEKMDTALQ